MSFYPEPWFSADDADLEVAQELWPMESSQPATGPDKNHGSVFRRYWEKLLGR